MFGKQRFPSNTNHFAIFRNSLFKQQCSIISNGLNTEFRRPSIFLGRVNDFLRHRFGWRRRHQRSCRMKSRYQKVGIDAFPLTFVRKLFSRCLVCRNEWPHGRHFSFDRVLLGLSFWDSDHTLGHDRLWTSMPREALVHILPSQNH